MYNKIKTADINWKTYKGEAGNLQIIVIGEYENVELSLLVNDNNVGKFFAKKKIVKAFNTYTPAETIASNCILQINNLIDILFSDSEENKCALCKYNTCDCPFITDQIIKKLTKKSADEFCKKTVRHSIITKIFGKGVKV